MTGMSREAAHAAIVLILSDVPAGYRFTDVADDILDAIWLHREDAQLDEELQEARKEITRLRGRLNRWAGLPTEPP